MTGSEKNSPLCARFQNRVIGTEGQSSPKAIICGIFFVMKVMHCGVLAVSVQSFLTTIVS